MRKALLVLFALFGCSLGFIALNAKSLLDLPFWPFGYANGVLTLFNQNQNFTQLFTELDARNYQRLFWYKEQQVAEVTKNGEKVTIDWQADRQFKPVLKLLRNTEFQVIDARKNAEGWLLPGPQQARVVDIDGKPAIEDTSHYYLYGVKPVELTCKEKVLEQLSYSRCLSSIWGNWYLVEETTLKFAEN